ncbi:MAG: efflux RND transporter periplasmic adaptor subunit [Verrucomicrobiales bacterium]
MPAKKRGAWPVVLTVLLLGGAAAGVWAWKSKDSDSAIVYRTAPIASGTIVQSVTANGQITPVKNVQVGSQVSGIVREVLVDFNSYVTNGQVVAQIDPATYLQNITQAEAELANAKAALTYAELNFNRARDMVANSLISASEFEKANADLQQAQAIVRTREASLNKSKVDLERTTIYAPIDGVVISRNIDVGQTVAASFNTPTLFQIANDLRQMRIEAMVSEADVGGIENGQKVNFQVDAFPNRQFEGKVVQVRYAPITNANVVSYTTVVEVNNSDMKLRPGMTANASIVTSEKPNVIRLPNGALRFRPPEGASIITNTATKGNSSTNLMHRDSKALGESSAAPGNEERRQRFGGGEGGGMRNMMRGGEGNPGRARAQVDGPISRTVYILDPEDPAKQRLKQVMVKLGISDGASTEVLDGLKEGDLVVIGSNQPAPAAAGPGGSPFGGPFGGGMRRR